MEFSHELALALVQSADPFPVNFEDAWQWIGYTRQDSAKKKLIHNFEEGSDFIAKRRKNPQGGRPSEFIKLTVDCFKSLGMMAGTDKGKEIRRYFLECERIAKEAVAAQLSESTTSTPAFASNSPARLTMLKEAVEIGNQLGGFDDRQKMLLKDQLMNLLMQERLLAADSTPVLEAAVSAEPEQPKRLEVPISDRCLDLGYKPNIKQLLKIGQVAAAFYRGRHGRPPQKREQFVGGTTRLVNVYTADDLGILDSAIQSVMGD
jgi:phage anti-repressor protein